MIRFRHLPSALPLALAAGFVATGAHAQSCAAPSFSLAPTSAGAPSATQNVAVGASPMFALTGDFDRDGHADIATANLGSDTISVAWGNGDGTFSVQSYPIPIDGSATNGLRPQGLAVGDFNSDGHPDLAVSLRNSNQLALMLGDGARGFALGTYLTVRSAGGGTPGRVVVGDFNYDGRPDVAVALDGTYVDYGQPGGIAVFLGDGAGHLSAMPNTPTTIAGSAIRGLTAGYFSGNDTILDLAAVDAAHGTLLIYRGNGNGFTLAQTLNVTSGAGAQPVDVTTTDFNSDGRADLLVANWNRRNSAGDFPKPYNDVALVLQGSDGMLSVANHVSAGDEVSSVAAADFNADGHPDIVVANPAFSFSANVRFGDGAASFGLPGVYAAGGNPLHVATADFNGDGSPDFVVVNQPSNTLSVYLDNCIPGNHAPIAQPDSGTGFSTDKSTAFDTASVLANDSDPDGDTLHVSSLDTAGTLGTVTSNGDGTFHYDPHGAFDSLGPTDSASDVFRYTVTDNHGTYATTTVTMTILGARPADLVVDPITLPSPLYAGGDAFPLPIVVHNDSDWPVANVVLDITLSNTLDVVDAAGCTVAAGALHCELGGLGAGASSTLTPSLKVPSSATGNVIVQATVGAPAPDPDHADNSAQATQAIALSANASIGVSDGFAGIVAGQGATYAIQVVNHGPSDIALATITASAPIDFTGVTWTCTASGGGSCAASGSGGIDDDVFLPSGATLSYALSGTLSPDSLADNVALTARVISAVDDPAPGDELATDNDAVTRVGDAFVGVDVASSYAVLNRLSRYVVTVGNHGPSTLRAVAVGSPNPTGLQGVVWTCDAGPGAHCGGSGNGPLADNVDLAPGAVAIYTVTGIATLDQDYLDLNASLVVPASDQGDSNAANDAIASSVPVSLFRSGFEPGESAPHGEALRAGSDGVATLAVADEAAPAPAFEGRCDGTPCLYVVGARRGSATRLATLARDVDGHWQAGPWQVAADGDARIVWARDADGATAAQLVDATGRALAPMH